MKYMQRVKKDDTVRNLNIDMAVEEYLADQRKNLFQILNEIETYPAGIQK